MRQAKGAANKTLVSCSNIIKLYNNDIGGVDITDKKTATYQLDLENKYHS